MNNSRHIFERMKTGEPIRLDDPEYFRVQEVVSRTINLVTELNATSKDIDQVRKRLSEIICAEIDDSTTVFAPFYTNFGRFIKIGKNVFVNHACTFLDMGGITLEDDVLIGPKVNLITESHPMVDLPSNCGKTQRLDWSSSYYIAGSYYWRKCYCGSRRSCNSRCTSKHNSSRCACKNCKNA